MARSCSWLVESAKHPSSPSVAPGIGAGLIKQLGARAADSNDQSTEAGCPKNTDEPTKALTKGPASQRTSPPSLTLLYGVRTAALLAGVDDFVAAGMEVEIATDDGTTGHHGFVTDLLAHRLAAGERPAKVVGCGPPLMLRAGEPRGQVSRPMRCLA